MTEMFDLVVEAARCSVGVDMEVPFPGSSSSLQLLQGGDIDLSSVWLTHGTTRTLA